MSNRTTEIINQLVAKMNQERERACLNALTPVDLYSHYKQFYGKELIGSPHVPAYEPKQKLSEKVQVSNEFRTAYNAWLEEFFGKTSIAYCIGDQIIGNPEIINNLWKLDENLTRFPNALL